MYCLSKCVFVFVHSLKKNEKNIGITFTYNWISFDYNILSFKKNCLVKDIWRRIMTLFSNLIWCIKGKNTAYFGP